MVNHLTMDEIMDNFADSSPSPRDGGVLEMIVRRPHDDERLEVIEADLDPVVGLVGDNWLERGSRKTDDGSAHPDMQIAIMNSRILGLLAEDRSSWPLAGDQLYIDLDLDEENLPSGQLLSIGTAVLEITDMPHHACGKFTERFGKAATRFLNSEEGRNGRRRGIYARVVKAGTIRVNDVVTKV